MESVIIELVSKSHSLRVLPLATLLLRRVKRRQQKGTWLASPTRFTVFDSFEIDSNT